MARAYMSVYIGRTNRKECTFTEKLGSLEYEELFEYVSANDSWNTNAS